MTRRILAALAVVAAVALAGCAATPASSPDDDTDHARIASVEQAAALHGVKVYWINAPRKKASGG